MSNADTIALLAAAAAAPFVAASLGAKAGIVRVAGDPSRSIHTAAWDAAWARAIGVGPFGLSRVKAHNLTELLVEQRDALLASRGQFGGAKIPKLSTAELTEWVDWWLVVYETGDDESGSGHDVDGAAEDATALRKNLAGLAALGLDGSSLREKTLDTIADLATSMDQFWLTDRDTSRTIGGGLDAAAGAVGDWASSLPGKAGGAAASAAGDAFGAIVFSTPVLIAGLAYVWWRFAS